MASINLSGVLRDSLGAFSHLNKIRFTHNSTTGTTLAGFQQTITIPEDGSYDIDIEYGNVFIESKDATANNWFIHGTVTINSDTVATDLPTLLNAVTPVTDEQLLQLQTLLEEASTARDEAEASATAAAESATETETAVTAFYNSNPANIDWDLFIPFNSDGELERGVGTRNSYGNKAVDFTRSTVATVVNKSGVLEDLAIDEIAVGKYGAWFHEAYTNLVTYSEDFENGGWSGSATRTSDYIVENGFHFNNVVATVNDVNSINQNTGVSVTDGDTLYISMVVNVDESSSTGLRVTVKNARDFDWDGAYIGFDTDTDATVTDLQYLGREKIYDGVYEYRFSIETDNPNLVYLNVQPYTSVNVCDVGENLVVTNVMLTNVLNAQYIKTEATAASVGVNLCTIPMNGNMPSAGDPFTIVVDAAIPYFWSGVNRVFFTQYEEQVLSLERATTGTIQHIIRIEPGDVSVVLSISDIDDELHRFTYVYTGSELQSYIDGEFKGSTTMNDIPSYSLDEGEMISLGGINDSNRLNSTLKNFGIIGRALTADEIKARGGVK